MLAKQRHFDLLLPFVSIATFFIWGVGMGDGRLNEKMKNNANVITGVDSFDSFYSLSHDQQPGTHDIS